MKTLISAFLVVLSGAAFAADLPSKKMAPIMEAPALAFSWTGAYVGGQMGYFGSRVTGPFTNSTGTNSSAYSINKSSFLLGAYAGYNYQFAGNIVVGVEGDVDAVLGNRGRRNGIQSSIGGLNDVTARQTYNGAIRGRLGYAYDRALFYVAGGFAFGNVKTTYAHAGLVPFLGVNSQRTGYTLGAGLDYAITNNIIARLEYRYTDLGRKSFNNPTLGIDAADSVKARSNAVLVGVAYKF